MLQFYHARQVAYWALGEIFSLDNNPLLLRGKPKAGHVSRQPCSRERLNAKLRGLETSKKLASQSWLTC